MVSEKWILAMQPVWEATKTHGDYKSVEYYTWRHMIRRCLCKDHPSYGRYGGRGINVCDRWRDYSNFLEDVGRRPGDQYSLDRIDNNGDYEPENVRWATRVEQSRNTEMFSTNTSGYKGVSWDKSKGRWAAYIWVDNKKVNLGRHLNIMDAVVARGDAEVRLWGVGNGR